MRSTIIGAVAGAAICNALVMRTGCSLQLIVSGGITGSVGQISSGQARVGDGLTATNFTLDGSGLTDSQGRGCFWTPPTLTLQCDVGQIPAQGFTIGCDGKVDYNGQTEFYECDAATDIDDGYNLYLEPNGINCQKVTFTANGCQPSCPSPSPSPSPTASPTPPPPAPKTCPANLAGPYEYPHLIIPVDKASPDTASGTSFDGMITSSISTIFNFDIPSGDAGKTCTLVFLFPEKKDLETSSFEFTGDGVLEFEQLTSPATKITTYNNQPSVAKDLGTKTVSPGNSYTIATFDCPAGQTVGFEIKATGHTALNFFQDYNPSPLGLYITKC